ncbi:MAG: hypothetical protein AB8G05_22005 [Oligoflexales bacterium]
MSTSGLARHLVKEGFLSDSDCQLIARDHSNTGAAFAKVVVALGILSEEKLAQYLREKTKCPMIPHKQVCSTQQDAEGLISLPLLQSLEVIPLQLSGDTLTVAMADPLDQNTLQQLKFFTSFKIKPTIATFSSLYLSLENLIQGFSAQKTTLEKFLSHHKLAVPPPAAARPVQGASFKNPSSQVVHKGSEDEDDENYDSYDDFNDDATEVAGSIDDIDSDLDHDSVGVGDDAPSSSGDSAGEELPQSDEVSAHGGSATWDEPSAGDESLAVSGADPSEDVDFWDEVEGGDEDSKGEGQTESLTAGQVELWDDDDPVATTESSDSVSKGDSLDPGTGQLWDDAAGTQAAPAESPPPASKSKDQEEDDLDLWSALEEGSSNSSDQESKDIASDVLAEGSSDKQDAALEEQEISEDDMTSQGEEQSLDGDVFSGDELNFDDDEIGETSPVERSDLGIEQGLESENSQDFAGSLDSLGEDGAGIEGEVEELEESSEKLAASSSSEGEVDFGDELSDPAFEEGEVEELEESSEELAASSPSEGEVDFGDELSDPAFEEGEVEELEETSSSEGEVDFGDELSDPSFEEGEVEELEGSSEELAASGSSEGEVDFGDELSDSAFEEGEVEELEGSSEELTASSTSDEEAEHLDELSDLAFEEGKQEIPEHSQGVVEETHAIVQSQAESQPEYDTSTNTNVSDESEALVGLENFDELQSMETQTAGNEEGLAELSDELSSIEGDDVDLGKSSQSELNLFDEDKQAQESDSVKLYASQQDLAIGFLNHGIAKTSLAFTPAKAQEAARSSLIKAGIPRGLILNLEDDHLSYLTHWNEDERNLGSEIKAIEISFEDLPKADHEQLWLDHKTTLQGLELICGDSSHMLRIHWGQFGQNASGVTIASWSDKAFRGEQLEVLSAKLVDQLGRKLS